MKLYQITEMAMPVRDDPELLKQIQIVADAVDMAGQHAETIGQTVQYFMENYPELVYHGNMYRGITLTASQLSKCRSSEDVAKLVASHGRGAYSYSRRIAGIEEFNWKHQPDYIEGYVIGTKDDYKVWVTLEQTARGLDIVKFRRLFASHLRRMGTERGVGIGQRGWVLGDNTYMQRTQEVLAPTDPSQHVASYLLDGIVGEDQNGGDEEYGEAYEFKTVRIPGNDFKALLQVLKNNKRGKETSKKAIPKFPAGSPHRKYKPFRHPGEDQW